MTSFAGHFRHVGTRCLSKHSLGHASFPQVANALMGCRTIGRITEEEQQATAHHRQQAKARNGASVPRSTAGKTQMGASLGAFEVARDTASLP